MNRHIIATIILSLFSTGAFAQRIVCDETCKIEWSDTPEWHDSPERQMQTVATMRQGMTAFIVTGDADRNKIQAMQGGGFSTVRIELPKAWDSLMQELGYKPLKEFYIKR